MKLHSKEYNSYLKYREYIKWMWEDGFINELEQDELILRDYAPIGEGHYRPLTFEEYKINKKIIDEIVKNNL